MAKAKTIKLCEGHKGGFGLFLIISSNSLYRGTPVKRLKVVLVDKEHCVQCLANRKNRPKGVWVRCQRVE